MSNIETCSPTPHKRGKNFKMKIKTCCSSSQTFGHMKFHKLNKKVNSEFGFNFGSQTKQRFIQTHKTHHGLYLRGSTTLLLTHSGSQHWECF